MGLFDVSFIFFVATSFFIGLFVVFHFDGLDLLSLQYFLY
jgi:hypothetical protein